MGRRHAQVEDGRPAGDHQLAIARIRDVQDPPEIAVETGLFALDLEDPGLDVVPGGGEDRITQEEAQAFGRSGPDGEGRG
jgi:hypothetical protein